MNLRHLAWAGIGTLTGGVFGIAFVVARHGTRKAEAVGDTLVVLGARVLENGEPSAALTARVRHAARLFRRGGVQRVILSGGPVLGRPSEASVMAQIARREGIPEEALMLEEESLDTGGNAKHSAKLIAKLWDARQVTVVTDAFHTYRARKHFYLEGIAAACAPVPLEGRAIGFVERMGAHCREAAILVTLPKVLFARHPRSRETQV